MFLQGFLGHKGLANLQHSPGDRRRNGVYTKQLAEQHLELQLSEQRRHLNRKMLGADASDAAFQQGDAFGGQLLLANPGGQVRPPTPARDVADERFHTSRLESISRKNARQLGDALKGRGPARHCVETRPRLRKTFTQPNGAVRL